MPNKTLEKTLAACREGLTLEMWDPPGAPAPSRRRRAGGRSTRPALGSSSRCRRFWALRTVVGQFRRFDGSYGLDAENVRAIDLTIDAGSLDTGNGSRDRHPRSVRFFDVAALQAATTVDQRELELTFSPASRGRIRACGMRLTTTKDLFSVLTGGAGNADHCARL